MSFETRQIAGAPDAMAPDGSEVRLLCGTERGSMAHFSLPAGAVSHAVAHRTVEEVWFFLAGRGRMWRRLGDCEQTVAVGPGTSITIPVGTHFQFRCDGEAALAAVGVTMPPWSDGEAYPVQGPWEPTT